LFDGAAEQIHVPEMLRIVRALNEPVFRVALVPLLPNGAPNIKPNSVFRDPVLGVMFGQIDRCSLALQEDIPDDPDLLAV
jgi:hypothetical protein